ncbi:MAG: DAK2 domain-containing protein, partial [Corynebacterium sp.]|nr:DAK2 domain-containing protein [Corynebacterium sp.]
VAEAELGGDVAEALAIGSARGARGNSGIVLSQVLRAVADSTVNSVITAEDIVESLVLAVELVDKAIAQPVEGTVVTVLRAAAHGAQAFVETEHSSTTSVNLLGVIDAAVSAARVALENTPSQLEALRAAGVVDAGGAGLVILLECLDQEARGTYAPVALPVPVTEHELEVVFAFVGDIEALKIAISDLGDSLVTARVHSTRTNHQPEHAAGSEDIAVGEDTENACAEYTVHMHSRQTGKVIETAYQLGQVSNIRLEVLPDHATGPESPKVKDSSKRKQGRVLVAATEGALDDTFRSMGATVVPSAEIAQGDSSDIFIGDIVAINTGAVRVVPATSTVSMLAAMSVYAPSIAIDDQVMAMREVTAAMRVDTPGSQSWEAIAATCVDLLRGGGELITILSEMDIDVKRLEEYLGVEITLVRVTGVDTEIGVE